MSLDTGHMSTEERVYPEDEIELSVKSCDRTAKLPSLSPPVILPPHSPIIAALAHTMMKDGSHLPPKAWHSKEHARTRDTMVQCISHLIQRRRTHVSKEWLDKVTDVAHSVEEYLYNLAASFEEYNDPATLISR